jgi:hypothetical protein
MYVPARPGTLAILRAAAQELGLRATGVSASPGGAARRLRPVRIALWDEPSGTPESGWIRWLLERYEFPFEVITSESADNRLANVDVLILASSARANRHAAAIRGLAERGGTVLAIGQSTSIAGALELPVFNVVAPLPRDRYFVPGSILRMHVDASQPVAYGLTPEVDVMFDNSPVFRLGRDAAERGVTTVAWFDSPAPLRSGWAWGQDVLEGGATVVEARLGQGRVVLFGPEITFRAQAHATFKFLFNGIYYGSSVMRPTTTE